jgi:threonine dehydratase
MDIPTLQDVLLARRAIKPYLAPTPFYHYPALDALTGAEVYVKHENHQPIGAFKVRGGINLVSRLSPDERARGLIAASTGNHGQSIAYAGRLFGAQVTIVVPEKANPGKVAAMQGLGATVLFHGQRFDDAVLRAEVLAVEHGYRYVHAGNEPLLIAGVATYALEMVESVPDLDVIFVPVGSGTGASGVCIAARALSPSIRVVAVQSAESPAAHDSWQAGRIVSGRNDSFSEGIATGRGIELPQEVLRGRLDDFVLVPDSAIRQAMVWMIERAHTLAESAGASPLAAAVQIKDQLAGKKIGLVCSGGNSSLAHLRKALDAAS